MGRLREECGLSNDSAYRARGERGDSGERGRCEAEEGWSRIEGEWQRGFMEEVEVCIRKELEGVFRCTGAMLAAL